MPDITFNTPAGQTIDRELMLLCLNTGTNNAPVWSRIGVRVPDSSMEYDWSDESEQDILGVTHSTMKKPVKTQSFDPWPLTSDDPAVVKIWNLAIEEENAQALANQDVLVIHSYAGRAYRHDSSMVKPTRIGGEGGGRIEIACDVTYGGTRTKGTAAIAADGAITFTADSE